MLMLQVTGTSNAKIKACIWAKQIFVWSQFIATAGRNFSSQPVVLKVYSGNDRFHNYIHHMH